MTAAGKSPSNAACYEKAEEPFKSLTKSKDFANEIDAARYIDSMSSPVAAISTFAG